VSCCAAAAEAASTVSLCRCVYGKGGGDFQHVIWCPRYDISDDNLRPLSLSAAPPPGTSRPAQCLVSVLSLPAVVLVGGAAGVRGVVVVSFLPALNQGGHKHQTLNPGPVL